MIAIPAVDLREGACVQLVGGAYEQERVRLPDPVAVAEEWVRRGFTRLHVVDLDAATGRGSNREVVRRILAAVPTVPVQVGGGVRTTEDVEALLAAGARWVVVGTRALEDPQWLADTATRHPDRLIVAADVKGREVVTRGWQTGTGEDVATRIDRFNALPLAGLLVTAVHKEGQLGGTDLPLMGELAAKSKAPLLASGGVTTLEDLRELGRRNVAGAVLGMSLYTKVLDADACAQEFGR